MAPMSTALTNGSEACTCQQDSSSSKAPIEASQALFSTDRQASAETARAALATTVSLWL